MQNLNLNKVLAVPAIISLAVPATRPLRAAQIEDEYIHGGQEQPQTSYDLFNALVTPR
jgi:BarA-like signal transduction histidine kinase